MDLIIKNGTLIDEKGNFKIVDIGIENEKIKFIGNFKKYYNSENIINADGLLVSPGFIDIHSHNDFAVIGEKPYLAKVKQGITTEVIGNCGISGAPYTRESISFIEEQISIIGKKGNFLSRCNWENYIDILQKSPLTTNIVPLVGHGNLRAMVAGNKKEINDKDVCKMKDILQTIMKEGCWGFSTGLIYTPGIFASTDEIISLAKVVSRFNGIYSTHIRNEGEKVIESIKEVIDIGKKADISVEISHMKTSGIENWEKTEKIISLIYKKIKEGVNVNYDIYPYNANSTTIEVLLPPWMREGGRKKLLERLKDTSLCKKAKEEILNNRYDWENYVISCGWDKIIINQVKTKKNRWMEGMSIKEISEKLSLSEIEFLFKIILDEKGEINIICFSMSEDSIKKFIKEKISFIGTDGLPGRRPHPRLFGSFPRVIKKYVKEEKLLTLQEAIYKMSTGPAEKLGLKNRGKIKVGYYADIVIFDFDKIEDSATYRNPTLSPKGIKYIIVNGKVVIFNEKFTGQISGNVILKE